MGTASIHEGVRRMRFSNLLERQTRGEITQEEAAELLGGHVRTFQRWAARYEEDGKAGLGDRRLGRPSPKRAPQAEWERMLGLYRDKYDDFTGEAFSRAACEAARHQLGYTVTKLTLHRAGLVKRAAKRSAHRKKRARVRWAGKKIRDFPFLSPLGSAPRRPRCLKERAGPGNLDRRISGVSA